MVCLTGFQKKSWKAESKSFHRSEEKLTVTYYVAPQSVEQFCQEVKWYPNNKSDNVISLLNYSSDYPCLMNVAKNS